MTSVEKHKFATLDAMRGIAAVAVVIYHYMIFYHTLFLPGILRVFAFKSGFLAVDLFFVLSGFVIAFAYEAPLASGMSLRQFLLLRLVRVLPMIWVGVAIGTTLALIQLPAAWRHHLVSAIFNSMALPGWPGPYDEMFSADDPEWSLFFEVVANLLFAGLFYRLSPRLLAALMAAGALGTVAACFIMGSLANAGPTYHLSWGGLSRVVFSFFAGVALHRTRHKWGSLLPRIPAWALLTCTAVLVAMPVPQALQPFYDAPAVLVLSPLLVALASLVEPAAQYRKIAASLALISYPLYAIHWPLLQWCNMLNNRIAHGHRPLISCFAVATVIISYLLATYYDRPVRAVLGRELNRLWR